MIRSKALERRNSLKEIDYLDLFRGFRSGYNPDNFVDKLWLNQDEGRASILVFHNHDHNILLGQFSGVGGMVLLTFSSFL